MSSFVQWFVIIAVIVVAAVLAILVPRPHVLVNDETVLPMPRDEVERRLFGPLGAIRWAQMTSVVPGQITLTSRFVPGWTILVAILLFPIGLLAPLLVRPTLVLTVRFLEEGPSTRIQVAGSTRPRVAYAVADAVEALRANASV